MNDPVPEVTFDEFQRVRIHAGTIVEAAMRAVAAQGRAAK